jgi:hypothetical protein
MRGVHGGGERRPPGGESSAVRRKGWTRPGTADITSMTSSPNPCRLVPARPRDEARARQIGGMRTRYPPCPASGKRAPESRVYLGSKRAGHVPRRHGSFTLTVLGRT